MFVNGRNKRQRWRQDTGCYGSFTNPKYESNCEEATEARACGMTTQRNCPYEDIDTGFSEGDSVALSAEAGRVGM